MQLVFIRADTELVVSKHLTGYVEWFLLVCEASVRNGTINDFIANHDKILNTQNKLILSICQYQDDLEYPHMNDWNKLPSSLMYSTISVSWFILNCQSRSPSYPPSKTGYIRCVWLLDSKQKKNMTGREATTIYLSYRKILWFMITYLRFLWLFAFSLRKRWVLSVMQ